MQQFTCESIGTHLDIRIEIERDFGSVFSQIEERLTVFEQKYSRFIEGNWLYNINKNRTGELDHDGREMLGSMLDVAKKTHGYFDPTVGKRLTQLGYGNQAYTSITPLGESGYGNYTDIEIDGKMVCLHGNSMLEFGGIGKGYLIDIIRSIIEASCHDDISYMINFGGDMYARGGWKVGLESPFVSDEIIGTLAIDGYALACSAGTRRKWGNHHHLIDPYTGESSREVVASYIESHSARMADMYATALCVMPWDIACDIFDKTPEISGVIVRHNSDIFQKQGSRAEIFI